MGLARQALERPGAALLDLGGDGGQRDDPADVGDVALVGEGGQVVLDAVVPGGQGGGARQADGAVGGHQAAAGERGQRLTDEQAQGQGGGQQSSGGEGTHGSGGPPEELLW